MNPLCFVLMPFGGKPDVSGRIIDFDAVYQEVIRPAIEAAGLQPLRADEEQAGGIIHKPMFERLVLCEYAVADLTTANANVFYELGVRHARLPRSTVLLFAKDGRQLPFDVGLLRALPYQLDDAGKPTAVEADKQALTARLEAARHPDTDSPLFQLLDGYPDIDHTRTDAFRDQVDYSERLKRRLDGARREGLDALKAIEAELGKLEDREAGVIVDLFLSYRAVRGWDDMIALVERMPRPLAETILVQEQLALALNRAGRGEEAERVLLDLIQKRGPSSETFGILGRVYKDRWEAAARAGNAARARGVLSKAIDAYLNGFDTDWRDAYPGINAVTLMELKEPPDPRREALVPVVRYAVERRIAGGEPDYWDLATRLELAVLASDRPAAADALADALAAVREVWEPETTARNLGLIREARERRGEDTTWMQEIETALAAAGS